MPVVIRILYEVLLSKLEEGVREKVFEEFEAVGEEDIWTHELKLSEDK
jgi:hypothetical protein